ncbi:MAG: hypothetical protein IJJ47_10050 [Methanosphaera sp.]|nr:hypothetical protein [Methanosphaera sp.]
MGIESSLLSSNKKWSEDELNKLIKEVTFYEEDGEEFYRLWDEIVDLLIADYNFSKVECEFEVWCEE